MLVTARDYTGKLPNGTWQPVENDRGFQIANLTCRECGNGMLVGHDTAHFVTLTGRVIPDLACDNCEHQESVTLQGWVN